MGLGMPINCQYCTFSAVRTGHHTKSHCKKSPWSTVYLKQCVICFHDLTKHWFHWIQVRWVWWRKITLACAWSLIKWKQSHSIVLMDNASVHHVQEVIDLKASTLESSILSQIFQICFHSPVLQKTQQVWQSIALLWSIFCDQPAGCLSGYTQTSLQCFLYHHPLSSVHTNIAGSYLENSAMNLARKSSHLCIATWRITCLLHPVNLSVLQMVDTLRVMPNICSNFSCNSCRYIPGCSRISRNSVSCSNSPSSMGGSWWYFTGFMSPLFFLN